MCQFVSRLADSMQNLKEFSTKAGRIVAIRYDTYFCLILTLVPLDWKDSLDLIREFRAEISAIFL